MYKLIKNRGFLEGIIIGKGNNKTKYLITPHFVQRMYQRCVMDDDVAECLVKGEWRRGSKKGYVEVEYKLMKVVIKNRNLDCKNWLITVYYKKKITDKAKKLAKTNNLDAFKLARDLRDLTISFVQNT